MPIQYLKEDSFGNRKRVTEWEYAIDRASNNFRHVHQLPGLIIYQA